MQQTIELEQLYEDGTEGGGGSAVALIVRRWHWDDEAASWRASDEMAWTFELRDHRIRSWRPSEDREEALREWRRSLAESPVILSAWPMRAKRARSAATRRCPRAAVPALGLPLTRLG